MGDYTGRFFRLPFKKDTPEEVFDLVKIIACMGEQAGENSVALKEAVIQRAPVAQTEKVQKLIDDMSLYFCGHSAYLGNWDEREFVEEEGEEGLVLYSGASTKWDQDESLGNFLMSLLPYLNLKEGLILFRQIFEYADQEDVVYYTQGGLKKEPGMRWPESLYGYQHAQDSDPRTLYEDAPWIFFEIAPRIEAEKKKINDEWRPY